MNEVKINEEAKVAVISTCHMQATDAVLLERGEKPMGLSMKGEYGYLFWSPIGAGDCTWEDNWLENWVEIGMSREFFDNLAAVFALGYRYVMVDQDGEKADGLKVFDW